MSKVQKTKHKLINTFTFEALIIKANQLANLVLSAVKRTVYMKILGYYVTEKLSYTTR